MSTIYKSLLPIVALSAGMTANADVIAHFPMEVSENGINETVSGNHYEIYSALAPFSVAGARGQATRFDGYSNYIEAKLPINSTLNQFTFEFWCAAQTYPMMTAEAENQVTYTTIVGNLDEDNKTGLSVMLSSQGDLRVKSFSGGWALELNVYIDHSILDIFINDTWAASVRVFPTDASADGLGVISRGTTQVKQLSVYELDPKHQAGIGCIVNDDACQSTDDAYYNMLGCKVASPTSGVYIHRGHKVYR